MQKKSTPNYFHCIEDRVFRNAVYEPEADSFLFLDGLDLEKQSLLILQSSQPQLNIVEIGCGSGIVITHLASILSFNPKDKYHVVDVNPLALEATNVTWSRTLVDFRKGGGQENGDVDGNEEGYAQLRLHNGDLFNPFFSSSLSSSDAAAHDEQPPSDEQNLFDIVLFNPPYVPTSMEELQAAIDGNDVITAAWCGGPRGRVVVDRFMNQLPNMLKKNGVAYIIVIKENNLDDMMKFLENSFAESKRLVGLSVVIRRYTGEDLCLLKVSAL